MAMMTTKRAGTTNTYYIPLLLFAGAIALYFPSLLELFLKPSVFNIDDARLMDFLLNHEIRPGEVFAAFGSGKYYRPFLELSFLIDQRVWGAEVFGFRYTNLFIHAVNTVLVYLTVGLILRGITSRSIGIAALSSIIFGIHPIAVEPVAWVSGRTDALAAFWGLLSIWLYLSGRDGKWYLFPLSMFCAIGAALSKEVGLSVPLIIASWEMFYSRFYVHANQSIKKRQKTIFIVVLAVIPVYFLLRIGFFPKGDMSAAFLSKGFFSSGVDSSALAFISSFGFYIKKFFYPFPLNFVIEEIDTNVYALLGLFFGLFFIISHFIGRTKKYSFFLFWAMICLSPAALISFTDIAWTKWAERYLYFPLVPLSVITAMVYFELIESLFHKRKGSGKGHLGTAERVVAAAGICILAVFAFATYQRSRLWNDNLAFWADAYRKSPDSISVSSAYAGVLRDKGLIYESEWVLMHALPLTGPKHQIYYTLGNIYWMEGNKVKAEESFILALNEARADQRFALEGPAFKSKILLSLSDLYMAEAKAARDKTDRKERHEKGVAYMNQAYEENPSDTFLLYRIAKEYLVLGDHKKAVDYFKRYINVSSDDAYRQAAIKLIKKMDKT
jgi:hypothetical protein